MIELKSHPDIYFYFKNDTQNTKFIQFYHQLMYTLPKRCGIPLYLQDVCRPMRISHSKIYI